jgi:hypothetical protein
MILIWLQIVIRSNLYSDGSVSQHWLMLHAHSNHAFYKDLNIKFG